MNPDDRFKSLHPLAVFLDFEQQDWIELLYKNQWIKPSDRILSIEKPGEGNMNFVVRVKTTSTSLIVKQARPWVEKYPQIDAPIERILVEAEFYKTLGNDDSFKTYMPSMIGFDANNFVLAVEDLGASSDCTFMYRKGESLSEVEFRHLIDFVSSLHHKSLVGKPYPDNSSLKKLNHTHIFHYPYLEDNGFNLNVIQPGLQEVSGKFKTNEALKKILKELGEVYLKTGKTLVHGDYYPGSWLKTATGIKVIDPEFSHVGYAEFDMGVMVAHLLMAHVHDSQIKDILQAYKSPPGFSFPLLTKFCGTEIMRRIIGLAQLPLDLSVAEKSILLDRAERMIVHYDYMIT